MARKTYEEDDDDNVCIDANGEDVEDINNIFDITENIVEEHQGLLLLIYFEIKVITKVESVSYFWSFHVQIKMMKVENILYFWLSPIRKNKFHEICLFETLHPQKLISQ